MPDAASARWARAFDGYGPGVWLGVADSQRVVTDPASFPEVAGKLNELDPAPKWVAVKFGGDWGGLWGTPQQWGELAGAWPKGKVIPYIFATPEHRAAYRDIVGGLLNLGYPAVILDCEEQWAGFESALQQLLQSLNLESNIIAVTGYAWFGAFPDRGAAFGAAINPVDVVYMPQMYLSELTSEADPLGFAQAELRRVVPDRELLDIVGAADLPKQGLSPASVWYLADLDASKWNAQFAGSQPVGQEPSQPTEGPQQAPGPSPVSPVAETVAAKPDVNTNLGQALAYLQQADTLAEELKGFGILGGITADMQQELMVHAQQIGQNLDNLLIATEVCVHTARQLTGGE